MRINVTEETIRKPKKGAKNWHILGSCPIERAIMAQTIVDSVTVSQERVFIGQSLRGIKLPPAARTFIEAYDRGEKVKPFWFEIAIPKKYVLKV